MKFFNHITRLRIGFLKKTQDLFLIQNVMCETRFRSGSVPSKLDFVFSSEENIISDMEYEAPLGNSDHVVLCWRITVEHVQQPEYNNTKFNFWKADYAIINELHTINWQTEFSGKGAEAMWMLFKEKLFSLMVKYVPRRCSNKRKKKSVWISARTIKNIKRRNNAWSHYKKCPSTTNYNNYKVIRNEVNQIIRNDRNNYQKKLIQNFRNCLKDFTDISGMLRLLKTLFVS